MADDPAIRRRRLYLVLREARERAGYTQTQVAVEIGCHPSKVRRIEAGQVGVSKPDLQALLRLYGIGHRFDDLWVGRRERDGFRWWDQYRDLLSPDFFRYLEYENSAQALLEYQPSYMPGVLQSDRYAEAVIAKFALTSDDEGRRRDLLEVRRRRRELLADRTRRFFFVLDEAVIHRRVGSREVFLEQILRLRSIASQDNVTIQVVPFESGPYVALSGLFTLLEFDNPGERVLYLSDQIRGMVSVDDPDIMDPLHAAFHSAREVALTPEETDELLRKEADRLSGPM